MTKSALQLFAARQFDRSLLFAHRTRLARQVEMFRFAQPWDEARFSEVVAMAMRHATRADRE